MEVGLLWFDDDSGRDLESKVRRAAEFYQQKYGRLPDQCFVHPSLVPELPGDGGLKAGRVAIVTSRTVLPNHFWLGMAD